MRMCFHLLCTLCAAMLLCVACNLSNNANQPLDPVLPSLSSDNTEHPLNRPGHFLLGFWTIRIDNSLGVEIIPNRSTEMHLNCTHLLEATCSDCLAITEVQTLPDDRLSALLTLKHPFPGLLKYCAFDVRGIFISGADFDFPASGKSIAWGDEVPRILTFDGYTNLFNPTDFPQTIPLALGYIPGHKATGGDLSATLNPYIAYKQEYERCIFEAGTLGARAVELHVKNHPIEFGYAVDACWQLVDEPVTDPIAQFPQDANALEAYRISVEIGDGIDIGGGSAPISTYVFDHQGLDTIESVTIESPDLFDGTIELSYAESDTDNKWHRYEGTIDNSNQAGYGEYPVLVRVVDTVADQNLGQIDAWQIYILEIKRGWARTWGGVESDHGYSVAVDSTGSVYVVGGFRNTVDFDPGFGIDERTSCGEEDAYLCRFNSTGHLQWAEAWGGSGWDKAKSVAADTSGNVYVTGYFSDKVDFDPGPGIDEQSSAGDDDVFLCKFDSSGNYLWVRTFGENSHEQGFSVATDLSDGVYISGYFSFTADFDPGNGIENRTSNGYGDIFLSRFDSSGDFQWVRTWGGEAWDHGIQTVADSYGNIYITGSFKSAAVDFDPGPGVDEHSSSGEDDVYLSRFDSSGDYYWARTWGGTDIDCGLSVASDSSGNVFVSGSFQRDVDFDPGAGIDQHTSNGSPEDAFLSRFDSSGNYQWVRTWGGTGSEAAASLGVDSSDMIYIAGYFEKTSDLDPGIEIDSHTSNGHSDLFLSKLDSSGSFIWARTWGGSSWDEAYSVAVDSIGCAYATGFFGSSVDFDPGSGLDNHTSIGLRDIFLLKVGSDGNW